MAEGNNFYGNEIQIPISDIKVTGLQARQDVKQKGINELADSINKRGQLQAILVKPLDDGGYEVIAGQRRLMAITELGWETIRARIASEKRADLEYKIDSFTENLLREDMTQKEKIEVCTELHRIYGNARIVADKTGIPYGTVLDLVKYDRLDGQMKEMVKNQGLDMKVALQAQDAYTNPSTGEVQIEKAIKVAESMRNKSNAQRNAMARAAKSSPSSSAEEIILEGEKQPVLTTIALNMEEEMHNRLRKYAKNNNEKAGDAALNLIDDGLAEYGF